MTREDTLRGEERCPNGLPETNYVGGLFDLLDVAQPKSVLEIGSARGVSTEAFLLRCERVVCVDSWEGEWALMYSEFIRRLAPYSNYEVVTGRSPEVLRLFQDGEFDLVYIDANHGYDDVKADIAGAKRLTRRWLAGHDHIAVSGVAWAVEELGKPVQVFSDTSWLVDQSSKCTKSATASTTSS